MPQHIFHTKHDLTPEFGWAACHLLAALPDGATPRELLEIACLTASPLAKRSELSKPLAALEDVGLVVRHRDKFALSAAGRALMEGFGQYETGYRAAVHCAYVWGWLWHNTGWAAPTWSYREVCRQIWTAGPMGLNSDELVRRVVDAAAPFRAAKVSFSRASVNGVTFWLTSQAPPMVEHKAGRWFAVTDRTPLEDDWRLHLAAALANHNGELILDETSLAALAVSLFVPRAELLDELAVFARASDEFLLLATVPPRLRFNRSTEPFLNWMLTHRTRSNL